MVGRNARGLGNIFSLFYKNLLLLMQEIISKNRYMILYCEIFEKTQKPLEKFFKMCYYNYNHHFSKE